MLRCYKNIIYIIGSFAISVIFIWIISYCFSNSPVSYKYDTLLRKYVQRPDTIMKLRSEGNGTTLIGKHGVNAISDILKYSQQKVCIWGDSYNEAFNVNDAEKMPQVLTMMFTEHNYTNLMAFGVGMSGQSIANYYFDIPKYEKLVPSIAAHVIVLTTFDDTLPKIIEVGNEKGAIFFANPYRFELTNWKLSYQHFKCFLYDYGMYFLWEPIRNLSSIKMRFTPGIKKTSTQKRDPETSTENFENTWTYLSTKLRAQTSVPIIFVYCPQIPFIKAGQVNLTDPNGNLKDGFAKIAKLHNIQFIDVSDRFIKSYLNNNEFPRGFANSRPAAGHFNATGHKIVANAIFDFIRDNPDVIHTN